MALQIEHTKHEDYDMIFFGVDDKNYSDAARVSSFRRMQQLFHSLDIPYEVAEHISPNDTIRIVVVDATYEDELKVVATVFGRNHVYAAKYVEDNSLEVKDMTLTRASTFTNMRSLKLITEKQAKKVGHYLHLVGEGQYFIANKESK